MLCVFQDGLPDDVPEALTWMKAKAIKGIKLPYPGWKGLR